MASARYHWVPTTAVNTRSLPAWTSSHGRLPSIQQRSGRGGWHWQLGSRMPALSVLEIRGRPGAAACSPDRADLALRPHALPAPIQPDRPASRPWTDDTDDDFFLLLLDVRTHTQEATRVATGSRCAWRRGLRGPVPPLACVTVAGLYMSRKGRVRCMQLWRLVRRLQALRESSFSPVAVATVSSTRVLARPWKTLTWPTNGRRARS